MVPITDSKFMMLQVSQYKSVVVKPTKIPDSCIPLVQVLFVFWHSCAGGTAVKASKQTAIFRIQRTTLPSTRNVFLLTILNELGIFICTCSLICDSRQGLLGETQTGDISGKRAFMKLLQWWTIEHDSRLDWDLDSPSTAVHLGDEVLGRSEKWIFLLGNKFPEIIV